MDNQVAISGCPYTTFGWLYTYEGEFWLQTFGSLQGNYVIIFYCPAAFRYFTRW